MDDKKILLLLVEDEAMIREMYDMILTKRGFGVEHAEDGETALNKITANPQAYGLILLDIMLPKVDGITVLKKLKQNAATKNIPVFLLTNLGQESLIKEAMNLGAAQYWIKSNIFPMDLVKEIEAFLQKIEEETGKKKPAAPPSSPPPTPPTPAPTLPEQPDSSSPAPTPPSPAPPTPTPANDQPQPTDQPLPSDTPTPPPSPLDQPQKSS